MLEILLETTKKIDHEYLFNRFYKVIKFYCGYAVLNKTVAVADLTKYKERNLRYDIFLDANIPDSKTLKNLHDKLINGDSIKISEHKRNLDKYKIICLSRNTNLYFTTEEHKGYVKVFLNHTRIIDEILEENWDAIYNNNPHPNFIIPIYDALFKTSKQVVKDLIENNI